jgi:hypothetical protein
LVKLKRHSTPTFFALCFLRAWRRSSAASLSASCTETPAHIGLHVDCWAGGRGALFLLFDLRVFGLRVRPARWQVSGLVHPLSQLTSIPSTRKAGAFGGLQLQVLQPPPVSSPGLGCEAKRVADASTTRPKCHWNPLQEPQQISGFDFRAACRCCVRTRLMGCSRATPEQHTLNDAVALQVAELKATQSLQQRMLVHFAIRACRRTCCLTARRCQHRNLVR